MTNTDTVLPGLETCLASPPEILRAGARFGLLANQASVDRRCRYAHDVLSERFPGRLAALFSPQHGFWSTEQDNMVETPHGALGGLGVPIYSLYSATRRPSAEMLRGLDCFVVDLQDVGARVYTYAWTVSYCLEACKEAGVPVVVLDRPNPLGGLAVEGARLEEGFESFVGRAPIPMRHGLTLGELARYLNSRLGCDAELTVVPAEGWRRSLAARDVELRWIAPSPNLPRLEGAELYPGTVLLEGTNLSEGRGTTTPFEVAGAPFIDPFRLVSALEEYELGGVSFRPLFFTPTFQKWSGRQCGGVYVHVLEPRAFRPYRTALALVDSVRRVWPDAFCWRPPPYEYESEKMPIDILSGSAALREGVEAGLLPGEIERLAAVDEDDWWRELGPFLLYPD